MNISVSTRLQFCSESLCIYNLCLAVGRLFQNNTTNCAIVRQVNYRVIVVRYIPITKQPEN